ncbi:ATP-binding protein [Herbaspirillum sp. YR522]|uniref:hybrid sensor histidine kinase/response regulator n=1 Tax=Herbaspirillum sp. YR522 TaxID=1144342 RepID=UPI00138AD84E|nr:ATP-binding protein [Herbaspirillum sp. YR522]
MASPKPPFERQAEDRTAELLEALAVVEAQKLQLENALQMRDEIQRQLETELEDARLLHSISSMMMDEDSVDALYQKLVDAATLVMRSDFGSLQRYDEARGALEMIAHHGLDDDALRFWQWVAPGRATTCGRALAVGQRVVVPDFDTCDFIVGSDDLVAFRKAGVRAAQSTPLLTRSGRLVGMITTHWTCCHAPKERDLRLFDIIARQAADLIERNISAQALRRHADSLVEADRYKDEFLATLAHELRNPLAPLRTGLTLLKIGSAEQATRVLPMMERQLGHMVRLIDDLLDVSRISRGMVTLQCSRVALASLIESAVETSRPLINAANHQFTVSVPSDAVYLQVDVTRTVQIISNLLNNAAKYTPDGGRIDLVADALGNEAVIRITDNGVGIPTPMLPKIFELFTQVDRSTERSQSGLGVGLALARHLAQLHQGSIEVASPGVGGGSVFTLRLPIDVAHAQGAPVHQPGGKLQSAGQATRILIVDDNVDAARTLALLLGEMGHTTSVVTESPQALAAALAFKPDVMFLDLGMPHLNGFDLARQIRGHDGLKRVYLAALSGWGTQEDRAKSRDAGIDHHLTKPVMVDAVQEVLSNVVP